MSRSDVPRSQTARLVVRVASASVAAVAGVVLIGWVFDVEVLKGAWGTITMKTNAALGLLLSAVALWSLQRQWIVVGRCCAALAVAIGALTLLEHLAGVDLGIDQLLFTEPAGAVATASPNRMGPNGSTGIVIAGTALLLLSSGRPRAIALAQRLALVGFTLAILAVAGYLDNAEELYAVSWYTGIALHTAAALLMLHVGVLAARPDEGPVAVFTADGLAGALMRRLAVPIVVIPLVMGALVDRARAAEVIDRGLALAIFSAAVTVVLGWIVWHTTAAVAMVERGQRQAEADRDMFLIREREARGEAERASQLKDQFIAVLSHELRTPLNVMIGWTRMLEAETSPERHAHAAAIVARNGRMLARLVEDLLDVSRATAGQFEIARRPLRFNRLVRDAVDEFMPQAAEKGVDLAVVVPDRAAIVEGDAERLQQIVSNLLSNAIKFTPKGGRVDVTTRHERDGVVLEVADSGIGFDATFGSELFTPFRQADSSFKREHGGLGLGLSIARHIAELHGGHLSGTSPGRGAGATFTLRLPLANVAEMSEPATAETTGR